MAVVGFNGTYAELIRYEDNLAVVRTSDGEIHKIDKEIVSEVSFEGLCNSLRDARQDKLKVKDQYQEILDEIPQIKVLEDQIEKLTKLNTQLEKDLRQVWSLSPIDELPEGLAQTRKEEIVLYNEQQVKLWLAEHYPDMLTINMTKFREIIKELSPEAKEELGISRKFENALVISKTF